MNGIVSARSLNSVLSHHKKDKNYSVDEFLDRIGMTQFVLLLVLILAICYSTTNGLIQCMSITTQIPNRICTNLITSERHFIPNSSDIVYNKYCKQYRNNEEQQCHDIDKQPFNLTAKFELECLPDMKQKFSQIGMAYSMAMILGASMIGYLMDNQGRKLTILVGALFQLVSLLCTQQSSNQWIFLISFASLGFCGEFLYLPGQVLATELVSRDNSMQIGTALNMFDSLNAIIMIQIQKYSADLWFILSQLIVRVVVITVIVVISIPESPYYLFFTNQSVNCNKSLAQMSKMSNRDEIPLIDCNEQKEEDKDGQKTEMNFMLFQSFVLNGILWLSVVLIFQFMQQYAKYFPTDLYLTLTLETIACMVGYFISSFLIQQMGNKRTMAGAFIIIIILSLFQDYIIDYPILLYGVIAVNIFLASLIFNVVQLMPPMQFQPDIVGSVYAFVNVMGRIGGVIAPLLSELFPPNKTLVIFSLIGLICSVFIRHQKQQDLNYHKKLKEKNIEMPVLSIFRRKNTITQLLNIKEDRDEDFETILADNHEFKL